MNNADMEITKCRLSNSDVGRSATFDVDGAHGSSVLLTPGGLIWKRFRRNKTAVIALVILALLVMLSILAPLLATHDRDALELRNKEQPPSGEHWFGTDGIGRDVFTRLLYGGRVSLTVGFAASAIQLIIGVVLGSLAGYCGKYVDHLIMRLTDVFLSFPFLALAITAAAILGPGVYNTVLVIAFLSWTETCRLVRGQFLVIKESEYIEATRALGIRGLRIVYKHMLPNAFAPILISATLIMASAILVEAGLSFLGLGVAPPIPSWGNMLEAARNVRVISNMWWIWLPPGMMIFLAVLSINLLGDGLRDALDPRLKR